jgi:hypothetical protein
MRWFPSRVAARYAQTLLVANPQPDMTSIHNAFRQLPPDSNDIAPYFDGYLGYSLSEPATVHPTSPSSHCES